MSQVFVDATGRRKRIVGVTGFLVALFATLYLAVIGVSVARASGAELTTKATVTTTATPSASASASS
ncbi:hypothetical protein KOI35_39590 [Actinoplanes bogorensis]|uniref:Uncharacterized protein n=1 Tax=Paractinoplanes bogorensis TaxID=1610840 RepID=A0ABS5Z1U9_9ACTN|nr:hypothetical protein [Actinoplanes bogorensis]MBU2669632.1 hypothetical protein [Actinoplanes bogorensis]